MERVSTLWAKCEKRGKGVLWSHNKTNFISYPILHRARGHCRLWFPRRATKLGKAEVSSAEFGVDTWAFELATGILHWKLEWLAVLKFCFQGAFPVKCFQKSRRSGVGGVTSIVSAREETTFSVNMAQVGDSKGTNTKASENWILFTKIFGFVTKLDFISKEGDENDSYKSFQELLALPASSSLCSPTLPHMEDKVTDRGNTDFLTG